MLHIHNRQVRIGELDRRNESAIRLVFFEDGASDALQASARAILANLHKRRYWLACDCAAGADDTWPMLGPRDGRGGMHVFRFGHVAHRSDCPFAAAIRSTSYPSSHDDNGPVEGDWDLDVLFPPTQPVAARRDALSRLLRTALVQLGYDRLHVSAFDAAGKPGVQHLVETPFARLKHLGMQVTGEGATFRQNGLTFLPAWRRFVSRLGQAPEQQGALGGLFIGVLEEVIPASSRDGVTFVAAKAKQGELRSFRVTGRTFLPDADRGSAGPYWAIALVQSNGAHGWDIGDVLVIHALDRRTLLPVPSRLARETAQRLVGQIQFWRAWPRLATEVEICVPLFPSPYPVTPAFELVLANGKRIAADHLASPSSCDGEAPQSGKLDELQLKRALTAAVADALRSDG